MGSGVTSSKKLSWTRKDFSSTPFRLLENPFLVFFIFFGIFGQATFSSNIFCNEGFYASAKIEIDLISPTPLPPPQRFFKGFREIGKSTSGKTGVDISIQLHPLATPLDMGCQCHPGAREYQLFASRELCLQFFNGVFFVVFI